MRHHVKNRKFGRVRKQRKALLAGLARSLLISGRIQTTEAKAKAVRPYVEKLITKAGKGTLASRRLVMSRLGTDEELTKKLFNDVAPKYKETKGGYTRITKLPAREGDAAKQAIIELV